MSDLNYNDGEAQEIPAHRRGTTWYGAIFTPEDLAGNAVSLTGATVVFTVRAKADRQAEALLTLSSEEAGEITIANDGSEAVIEPVLVDLPAGVKHWDIEVTLADGTVHRPSQGTWRMMA